MDSITIRWQSADFYRYFLIIPIIFSITSGNSYYTLLVSLKAVFVWLRYRTLKAKTFKIPVVAENHLVCISVIGISHFLWRIDLLCHLINSIFLFEGNSSLTKSIYKLLCYIVEKLLSCRWILIERLIFILPEDTHFRLVAVCADILLERVVFNKLILIFIFIIIPRKTDIALVQSEAYCRKCWRRTHVSPVLCHLDLYSVAALIFIYNCIVADTVCVAVDSTFFNAVFDKHSVLVILIKNDAAFTVKMLVIVIKLNIVRIRLIQYSSVVFLYGSPGTENIIILDLEVSEKLILIASQLFDNKIQIFRCITLLQLFGNSKVYFTWFQKISSTSKSRSLHFFSVFIYFNCLICPLRQAFYLLGNNIIHCFIRWNSDHTGSVNDLHYVHQLTKSRSLSVSCFYDSIAALIKVLVIYINRVIISSFVGAAPDIRIKEHVCYRIVEIIKPGRNIVPQLCYLYFYIADQFVGDGSVIIGAGICFAGIFKSGIVIVLCVISTAFKLIVIRHITPHIINKLPLTVKILIICAIRGALYLEAEPPAAVRCDR